MEMFIRENGKTEKEMEEEHINSKTVEFMKDNFKILWNTDLEFIILLMEIFIRENSKMMLLMEKALITIKMELRMKGIG
jgi:hypothetical protein